MPYYEPWLTTLEHVKQHRDLSAAETDDDAFIQTLIEEASAEFVQALDRLPVPYVGTHLFDVCMSDVLDVKDLLAITTLTNGNGAAIAGSAYVLESAGYDPKWRVRLKQGSGVRFTYSDSPEQAIAIDGVFGYVPHYLQNAFTSTGIDLHTDGISSSDITHTLDTNEGDRFEVGQYIRLEAEICLVVAHTSSQLTLERAQWGTVATAHDAGTIIETFNFLRDMRGAVREIVAYRFKKRNEIGSRVSVFQGGTVVVEELDPSVQKSIDRHRYGKFRIGVA
ncbi:MAG: hypothetical protein CL610_06070 [Anaerolineaceae bacterium]|nr:hypothetical protein [Anaerolineaceae bacterium]